MINYKLTFEKPTVENHPEPFIEISDDDYDMYLSVMPQYIRDIQGVLDIKQDKDGGLIVTTDGITEKNFCDQLFALCELESQYLVLMPIIKL